MRKNVCITALVLVAACAGTMAVQGGNPDNGVMSKRSDGTYVVNTTSLAKDVRGFKGNTPLKVYIKSNRVVKVEALPNQESPNFFNKVNQGLLDKWNGMKTSKAATVQVDGVTGATYSSKAVKENVKRAVKYYQKNK